MDRYRRCGDTSVWRYRRVGRGVAIQEGGWKCGSSSEVWQVSALPYCGDASHQPHVERDREVKVAVAGVAEPARLGHRAHRTHIERAQACAHRARSRRRAGNGRHTRRKIKRNRMRHETDQCVQRDREIFNSIFHFDPLPLKGGRTCTGMHVWHGRCAG